MNHRDHVNLLQPAYLAAGGVWADFGAGSGAFTLALRELVGLQAEIHAVDQRKSSLEELKSSHNSRFHNALNVVTHRADFTHELSLPPLDGIIMANSLHYYKDKVKVLSHARSFLKPGGILLLVEYNVDKGNPWVPFPLSFGTYRRLARQAGFSNPKLLARHPSSFLREFYSAEALRE